MAGRYRKSTAVDLELEYTDMMFAQFWNKDFMKDSYSLIMKSGHKLSKETLITPSIKKFETKSKIESLNKDSYCSIFDKYLDTYDKIGKRCIK